jgi:hypothetical protein
VISGCYSIGVRIVTSLEGAGAGAGAETDVKKRKMELMYIK